MNSQGWFPLGLTWLDLLVVQGTLKSFLQHYNLKASILQCSGFFMVQLSHLYMTMKNNNFDYMDFCQQNDISAFNMLYRFVMAFLPRRKYLLISRLQSPSAVILELKKTKSFTPSNFPLLFAMQWWDGTSWSSFFKCCILSQLLTLLFHPYQEALRGLFTFCH